MTNHTTTDVLAYIDARVRSTLECALDAIGGNIPSVNADTTEMYDGNEAALDMLDALADEIHDLAKPYRATNYSDGRPLQTEVPVPGGRFVHLWHPDPEHQAEHTVRLTNGASNTQVTITPPLTITTRTLAVAESAAEVTLQ